EENAVIYGGPKAPPHSGSVLSVVDMHTGGEPLRIILSGYPEVKGDTILGKQRYVRDPVVTMIYGAILVRSELAEADLGVLFMHNEGYSTVCGHAVIALMHFAVDYGLIKTPTSPETQINIHCPCGLVKNFTQYFNGKTGTVRFHSVPLFAFATDASVSVPGYWSITVDISYGGALYAFVSAKKFGLDVNKSKTRDLVDAATAVSDAFKSQVKLYHPVSEDLAFLYGTILTDGKDAFSKTSCTGSGVTARIALQYHKGLIGLNQTRSFKSGAIGSVFTGKAIEETTCGDFRAVVVEVTGHAHYSGVASFTQESDDPQSGGFLLR
uniref:trans-L-3-hydroxyproline dehydratase n=1 Tax=Cyprinus carpio TaxID=7962 RepID=A0A8C1XMW1_CYPCA